MFEITNKIKAYNEALLREYPESRLRGATKKIDFHERLIGIWGPKGVGKTTSLITKLREERAASPTALYLSLDHPMFANLSLLDFGTAFYRTGGKKLLLDEVHKYPNWSSHIKALHDTCHNLAIVFSGSSALHINKGGADLSRRAALYKLPVLSLREYIMIQTGLPLEPFSLVDLQKHHVKICGDLSRQFKPLQYFPEYLEHGAYPFYQEGLRSYGSKLVNVINETLESDLVFVNGLNARYASKLRGLLNLVAESVPFAPKVNDLAQSIGISRPTVSQYLEYLADGGLITLIRGVGRGYQKLSKPEKLYLDNSNLAYALGGTSANIGALRETFFVSQLKEAGHLIEAPSKADFLVDGKYTFEVGGASKKRSQIAGTTDAQIILDGIEVGTEGSIPLWILGFLY
jgi:predicted AAA+ superfamily ATPase